VDREFEDLQRKVRESKLPPSMQRGAKLQVNPETIAPASGTSANWSSPLAWRDALAKAGLRDVQKLHSAMDAFTKSLGDILALNLSVCEGIYTSLLSDG